MLCCAAELVLCCVALATCAVTTCAVCCERAVLCCAVCVLRCAVLLVVVLSQSPSCLRGGLVAWSRGKPVCRARARAPVQGRVLGHADRAWGCGQFLLRSSQLLIDGQAVPLDWRTGRLRGNSATVGGSLVLFSCPQTPNSTVGSWARCGRTGGDLGVSGWAHARHGAGGSGAHACVSSIAGSVRCAIGSVRSGPGSSALTVATVRA